MIKIPRVARHHHHLLRLQTEQPRRALGQRAGEAMEQARATLSLAPADKANDSLVAAARALRTALPAPAGVLHG